MEKNKKTAFEIVMENRKEARQLLYSLMDYMSSTAFHPQVRLTPVQLQKLNPDL